MRPDPTQKPHNEIYFYMALNLLPFYARPYLESDYESQFEMCGFSYFDIRYFSCKEGMLN